VLGVGGRVLIPAGSVRLLAGGRSWQCLADEGSRRIAQAAPVIHAANDGSFEALSKVDFLVLGEVAARLEESSGRAVEALAARSD